MVRILCLFLFVTSNCWASLNSIKLPPGFQIEIYAAPVPGARQMALGSDGVVYVGGHHHVYALLPNRQKNKAQVKILVKNLNSPCGVAYHAGDLYIGEINRISVVKQINPHQPIKLEAYTPSLPNHKHHGRKYIKFGPDGYLYLQVGMPCNVCLMDNPIFGSLLKYIPQEKKFKIIATGVRSNVGLDWDPQTQHLWFTDNGRDWMGDDVPPDELNRLSHEGAHFGFPFMHGKSTPDPKYGRYKSIKFTPPEWELPAHVAPLGMTFYTGKSFPKRYHHHIFIAEHGSWNRRIPIGYRVSMVKVENGHAVGYELFAHGWLGDKILGRPVDVLVMKDGSLLVSDDYAGAIYRIYYHH